MSDQEYAAEISSQLTKLGEELRRIAVPDGDICFLAAGYIQGLASRCDELQRRDDYVTACLV